MIDWDAYQAYGWSFFPVHARSAEPAIEWKRLQTERPSADDVAKWRRQRFQNIGIVTGAISGFIVLDIDSDEAQAIVDKLGTPPTTTVKTKRGRHYYFKHPGFKVKNAVEILDGKIDIRGDGGFVIGPGSHHKKDHSFEYTWEDSSPIAEAPQWLLDEIKPKERPALTPKTNGTKHHHTGGVHPTAQRILDEQLGALAQKTEYRNNALNDAALKIGHYIESGRLSESRVRSLLLDTALRIGLEEREALNTIESGLSAGMAEPRPLKEPTESKAPTSKQTTPRAPQQGITAADLQRKKFEPVRWAVDRIFVEGVTLLAARPKRGKSYLALNCALAVASGGYALSNIQCEQGDVLGLFLEDNERRLADRITQLLPNTDWPARLTLHTTWPRLDEGGLIDMEQWIQSVEKPRLIIVDVLASVRAKANGKTSPYADDYGAMEGLRALALKYRLAIVAIHHCRKATSDGDPFDEVSGTTGLTGAASSTLVLKRGEGRSDFLYGRGHDMPEFEYAVSFDKTTGLWRLLGDAEAFRGNEAEKKIITTLVEAGEEMGPREIADAINGSYQATKQRLYAMAKAGQIRKTGRARYAPV